MIDALGPDLVALTLGSSEPNEPIYGGGGVIVFGLATLALYDSIDCESSPTRSHAACDRMGRQLQTRLSLSCVRDEMTSGIVPRLSPVVMLLFAVLSLRWPWRPWPH